MSSSNTSSFPESSPSSDSQSFTSTSTSSVTSSSEPSSIMESSSATSSSSGTSALSPSSSSPSSSSPCSSSFTESSSDTSSSLGSEKKIYVAPPLRQVYESVKALARLASPVLIPKSSPLLSSRSLTSTPIAAPPFVRVIKLVKGCFYYYNEYGLIHTYRNKCL